MMENEMKDNSIPKARKVFRILAGVVALLCIPLLVSSVHAVIAGRLPELFLLILATLFITEFGCVALQGDGLWLYKSKRFKKRKPQKDTEQSTGNDSE